MKTILTRSNARLLGLSLVAVGLGLGLLLEADHIGPVRSLDQGPTRSSNRPSGLGSRASASGGVELAAIGDPLPSKLRLQPESVYDPFGPLGTPAAVAVAAVSPAPVASRVQRAQSEAQDPEPIRPAVPPALPFVAVGSITGADVTQGSPVAFLKYQEHIVVVRAGDAIANTYRVDAVTSQAVQFTYLPLMQQQSLSLLP